MSPIAATLTSVMIAWTVATLLGLFAGYLSVLSPRGRTFSLWLTEVRGGMPAALMLFVLSSRLPLSDPVVIGLAVGASQATSIARWMASTHAHWSDSLIAEVLLGRRASFFFARSAVARGAVRGVSAAVPCYVVLWECALVALRDEPTPCLGSFLIRGSGLQAGTCLLVAFGLTVLAEWLGSAWFLGRLLVRRRPR